MALGALVPDSGAAEKHAWNTRVSTRKRVETHVVGAEPATRPTLTGQHINVGFRRRLCALGLTRPGSRLPSDHSASQRLR